MKRIIALFAAVAMLALLAACGATPPPADETLYRISAETRDNILVPAGNFWEAWWNLRGPFAWEHITEGPNDPVFAELQPTSGFAHLNELRLYLLQYYTEAWLDANLSYYFRQEGDMLLINSARAGFPRPDWSTMAFRALEHDGQFATQAEVEVTYGSWHREPGEQYPHEAQYRFTFVGGRIDTQVRVAVSE